MDTGLAKPILQSHTIRYLIGAGIVQLVKMFGLPLLPADIHAEVVNATVIGLEVVLTWCLLMAGRARIRAKEVLAGWKSPA